MNRNLKRGTLIFGIAMPVFILSGVLFYINYESTGGSMHPDIKRPGTVASIEDLEFTEEIFEGISDNAPVYRSDIDVERSIRNASACIGVDIKDLDYTYMPGQINTRKYKLPGGMLYLTESTGYWNYKSDTSSSEDGVVAEKFISDDEIKVKTAELIKSYDLLDGKSYNVSMESSTTCGWNSPEKIMSKDVYVYPNIDAKEVYGVDRMIVSYDSEGNIIEIFYCCNPVSKVTDVALKSADAVKKALDAGDYSAALSYSMKSADIRSVKLAYYADSAPNHKGKLYIYPVYVLTAEGTGISNDTEEFDIIVDAVA